MAEAALPLQEAPEEAEQVAAAVALEAVMEALQAVHQASKSVMLVEAASLVIPVEDVEAASLAVSTPPSTNLMCGLYVLPYFTSACFGSKITISLQSLA